MSNVSNNHSSMNIDYSVPFQPGSKRKASDNGNIGLLNNGNSGLATANNVNNSLVRQKITDGNNVVYSNHNANSASYTCTITGTSVHSQGKKVTHTFGGMQSALVPSIGNEIQRGGLLDGDGCAVVQEKDDIGQVVNEPMHVHFKVEGGIASKFIGKMTTYNTIIEAPFAVVKNLLIAHGTATYLRKKDGAAFHGNAVPRLEKNEYIPKFLDGEGSYQGKMPPPTVVIFAKKIENGKETKAACLPSGEFVPDLQKLADNVWVGKKENSPDDDGKIINGKLQGKWVKFVRYDVLTITAYDGNFENDVMVEGTIYTPEGIAAKVTKPSK